MRVSPLAGEALDSWLETYCRRLDVTTGVLLAALGLRNDLRGLPDHTIWLHQPEAHRLAYATSLEVTRLHALTLRAYDGHILRVDQLRRHVTRHSFWARPWGSRFCPRCLSERDGRWLLRWRLSFVFACTDHRVLLHDTCPTCGRIPRRRIVTFTSRRQPAATCAGGRDHPCGTDLRGLEPLRLHCEDPLLATQHWINLMLSAIEAGITDQLLVPPAVAFADLRAVGGWLLRGAVEGDIGQFGPYAERAWQAFCNRTPSRPFLDPPRAAALIGAVATIARALITRDDDDAFERLRSLLGASGRSKLRARGLTLDQWQQLSDPVRGRFLRAIDQDLATVAWIRYCLGIPEARVQITGGDPPAVARTTDGPVPAETGFLLPAPTSLASFRP